MAIRADLGFSVPAIGLGTAAFFIASAVSSPALGRETERIGSVAAMRASAPGIAVCLLLIAEVPHAYPHLLALLVAADLISGFTSPAVSLFLAERIPEERQGLVFGVKHSAIPHRCG